MKGSKLNKTEFPRKQQLVSAAAEAATSFGAGVAAERPASWAHILRLGPVSASPSLDPIRERVSLAERGEPGGRARSPEGSPAPPAPRGRQPPPLSPPRPGPAHWLPLGGEETGRPRGAH